MFTICPIIEYGFVIYGTDRTIARMEKLQNRALKIALRANKSANPILYQQFFNVQTIAERLDRIRVKLRTKYTRAHPSLLIYETFNGLIMLHLNNYHIIPIIYNLLKHHLQFGIILIIIHIMPKHHCQKHIQQ